MKSRSSPWPTRSLGQIMTDTKSKSSVNNGVMRDFRWSCEYWTNKQDSSTQQTLSTLHNQTSLGEPSVLSIETLGSSVRLCVTELRTRLRVVQSFDSASAPGFRLRVNPTVVFNFHYPVCISLPIFVLCQLTFLLNPYHRILVSPSLSHGREN